MKKICLFLAIFVFMMSTMGVISFGADYTFYAPPLPTSCDAYIIYWDSDWYINVITYNSSDWTPTVQGNTIKWTKHRDTAYVRYYTQESIESYNARLDSGDSDGWDVLHQYDTLTTSKFQSINMSTHTIYDSDGKVVFLVPPPLEEKVEEGLLKLQQHLGGTTSTLVLCGVGCLACLMVLNLFGKRSQIFHL